MWPNRIQVVERFVVAGDSSARSDSKFHTFPSLTRCCDGSFLCTTLVGSEKTAPDARIKVFRSTDMCCTWSASASPTSWDEESDPRYGYMMCHTTELAPAHLLASYARTDRFNPTEPLFHPKTSGMQHTVVRLAESRDNGRSWSKPWDLDYTLPDLIAPGPFVKLADGSLGMPFEVWHEWEKGFREGPSTRLAISHDNGKTWPRAGIIARDELRQVIYGDPRLTLRSDGGLIALLWANNFVTEEDLPVHWSESAEHGQTWTAPRSTNLIGQIANPVVLGDGLMLAVYQKRFGAEAGLRAVLSHGDPATWDEKADTLIWGAPRQNDLKNPFAGYQGYTFGYSTTMRLSESQVLIPFWASNGKSTYIQIVKLKVT